MSTAKVYQLKNRFDLHRMFRAPQAGKITAMLKWNEGGVYQLVDTFQLDLEGEAAAEELFDLTNNPSREDEYKRSYPAISVGDIVEVDDRKFVCLSVGWESF